MDTAYAVDNMYNRTLFAKAKGKDEDMFSWDDHYDALREQIGTNFEYCSRLNVGDELGRGEYDDKGIVMIQLKKLLKDFEKPILEVEIDPWTRYKPLEKERTTQWSTVMRAEKITQENMHPIVKKYVARREYYNEIQKKGGAQGEIEYKGKKLISINGKVLGGRGGGYTFTANKRPSIKAVGSDVSVVKAPEPVKPPVIKADEVKTKAIERKNSLAEKVLAERLDEHVQQTSKPKPAGVGGGIGGMANQVAAQAAMMKTLGTKLPMAASVDNDLAHEMAYVPPKRDGDGLQDTAEAMWARMNDDNMSPAQAAELNHIRSMINSLTQSLEGYKKAEKDLMLQAMRQPKNK